MVAVLAAGAALLAHNSGAAQSAGAGNPAMPEFYTGQVRPVLQANCYRCHSGFNHRGGLQLDTKEHLLHGGKDGAVIVPGHAEQSLLVELIRHEGPARHPMPMPPKSKLSDADIATITRWVQAGAVMPADAKP
jgi:mono/diheme cytochrome c family protein